ncbi:hypothetical protein F511_24610 [Dorcoceras hygrometricum]|uniref:Uncharacterized protein n=1 Tax=Dorcoceras hygrometricum TaxID=472368 RepID=A0A2Z7CHZ7_9LAMI|nr:hypothetical protein F511_24610 [Dorcoceras hygrometricum]
MRSVVAKHGSRSNPRDTTSRELTTFVTPKHIFGLTHRIMVKRLATSPHDPLGITDSACKNQSVMISSPFKKLDEERDDEDQLERSVLADDEDQLKRSTKDEAFSSLFT